MESRVTGQSAGIGKLFWGFSNGYLKLLGTQFLRSLITEGIVFLCMAPGLLTLAFNRFLSDWVGSAVLMACGAAVGACFSIYFQYCYLMVPYILAENPDMKAWSIKMSLEPIFMDRFFLKIPRWQIILYRKHWREDIIAQWS